MKKLYLIRHSTTEGVEKNWIYGAADIPITQGGAELAKSLKDSGIYPTDVTDKLDFYTSGLIRTIQTMKIIFGDVEYRIIPELKEINFGAFECKTAEELDGDPDYELWVNDKTGTAIPPNGESYARFHKRVCSGFKSFIKELDKDSVLVCHGGVIAAVMNDNFGSGNDTFYNFIVMPCHGYVVEIEDGMAVSFSKI